MSRKYKHETTKEYQKRQSNWNYGRFYTNALRSLLGNNNALFYVIIGGRMTGKSYAVADFLANQHKKHGENVENYWFRISETSTKALLCNKASKLFDADLVRKYRLDLTTKGMDVFNRGKKMLTVCPLSQFAKLKGVAFYDKDYQGYTNIVLDEFQLEKGEKRTSFDILYNFIGMIENTVRTRKSKVRIFIIGNTLEEASSILKAFDFLPHNFGRFYLTRKRCVIDNIEPTKEYLQDRYGSAADILGGRAMSNYTNELKQDASLIDRKRLQTPRYIIKFGKDLKDMFLVWDDNVITPYKKQPVKDVVPMYRSLDATFIPERREQVIEMFDLRLYKFNNLITHAYFQDALRRVKK